MNVVDFIFVGILLVAALIGLFRGFIYQFATLLALAVAFFVSPYTAMPIVRFAAKSDMISEIALFYMARIVTGSVIYFLLSIGVWYLDQRSKEAGIKGSALNRLVGMLVGLLKGASIVAIILFALQFVPKNRLDQFVPIVGRSKLVGLFHEHRPIPYDVVESNLQTILTWMKDPQQSEQLAKKLKDKGIETKGVLGNLREQRWVKAIRNPKFFALLKDPNFFEPESKAPIKSQDETQD